MTNARVRLEISGRVQGVGFRATMQRLALSYGVCGWVMNSAEGVLLEAEATPAVLEAFVQAIPIQKPARAIIDRIESLPIPPTGCSDFVIRYGGRG